MEFAADHLDRLLGKSILDRAIHERGMAENGDASGSDQPKKRRDRRRNKCHRDSNTGKTSVELRRGGPEGSNFQVASSQLADRPHAANDEDNVEEKPEVGEQAVNAEHDKDHGIVA